MTDAPDQVESPPAAPLQPVTRPQASLQVIGIGTSTGGLEALRSLLDQLGHGLDHAAVILAQHLSPTHQSKLVEILSLQPKLRIVEAQHDQKLEANTIYVTPENRDISLKNSRLQLCEPEADKGSKPSIDALFQSLALDQQELAVGVILTGMGNDGAAGIQEIHRAGGITLVQDPREAQAPGMPEAAIATGCVDRILPLAQLGAALAGLIQPSPAGEPLLASQALPRVLQKLSQHSGIDFSQYKMPTLFRRLQKRLTQLGLKDAEAYLDYLQTHPEEPGELFKLMLIGVTRFQRDPEAFTCLAEQLAEMVAAKGPEEALRIWVPGCSTGEEAYTLAFYLYQLMPGRWKQCELQIFASDLDERAIASARKGLFPAAALDHLPAELIRECFLPLDDGFEVKPEIRAKILFTRHDLAGNPPFLKLDLISCRNLLIYFTPALQQQLIPIFHYALNPNGYLFLGKSESIGEFTDLFETISSEHKIFRRKQGTPLRRMQFTSFKFQRGPQPEPPRLPETGLSSLSNQVKETLFATFECPYVVLNDSLDVLEISGDVRLYLGLGEGQLTSNILRLILPALQIELLAVINRSQQERSPRRSPICRFEYLDKTYYVRFSIKPMLFAGKHKEQYLLIFEPIDLEEQFLPLALPQAQGHSDEVAILRHELATIRTQMQTYIEQLETSNEELLALNQEQLSSNEEFQSTNEELETSHEELQSSFEEVQAAYAELHASNEALEQSQFKLRKAEANVWALINNTLQAFILVDSRGDIVAFNQQAVLLFQKISGCLLAPGQSFRSCLVQENPDALLMELGKALKGEVCSGEELVQTPHSGQIWLAYSFTPAQTHSQGAQAVSVSLLDISERVHAQQGLQTQSQRFKALIENSFDGIAICQNFGIYSYISPAIERLVGYRADEMLFHHSGEFIHPDDLAEMGRIFANLHLVPSQAAQLQWRQRHKSGEWRWFEGVAVNSLDVPGIEGTILNFRDVTERLLQEQAIRLSEVRLRQIIDIIPAYIYARDSLNRCVLANAMTARLFNLSPQELEGKRFDELPGLLPENEASLQADQAVREQGVLRILPEFSFGSGQARQLLSSYKIPYTASDSGHPATLTVTMDLSGFKQAKDLS